MPNGEQEQDSKGEASGGESGEWHSDGEEDDESETRVMKKRSTHLLIGKADPSSLTIQQAPATKRLFKLGSRQSVLGRLL